MWEARAENRAALLSDYTTAYLRLAYENKGHELESDRLREEVERLKKELAAAKDEPVLMDLCNIQNHPGKAIYHRKVDGACVS